MTLDELFLTDARRNLQELVESKTSAFPDTKPPLDRYIALSLMQKAIRRGNTEYALVSARFLLCDNSTGFWKRLAIIGLEDIGVANIPLVAQVLIATGDQKLRQELGGNERVASALICEMCASPKDRSTDDLFDVLDRNPAWDARKADLAEMSQTGLWSNLDLYSNGVEDNALVLVELGMSWSQFSVYVGKRSRWPLVISMLPEENVSPCIKETAVLGLQRTGLLLAPLLAALSPATPKTPMFIDDDFLPEQSIQGLPNWAFGMHTRVGLAAFRSFSSKSTEMKSLLAQRGTSQVSKSKAIGGLVFRLECGQLRNRLDWDVGHKLKRLATGIGWGLPDDLVPDGLRIIADEFDQLNECRAQAFELYLR